MLDNKPQILSIRDIRSIDDFAQEGITKDNEWVYRKNRTIEHRKRKYYVDLDRCESSAAVLDWIFQIFAKRWCTPKTLHDLMLHLRERVNPQATLCSWGMSKGTEGK